MLRHPEWLRVEIPGGENYVKIKSLLRKAKLHTICEEAKCPNMAECFGKGTATFLILGNVCTRSCRYCNVKHGKPLPLNPDEPREVAESVKALGLRYAVITSVTRDDLPNGGATVFYETVKEIKKINKNCRVEVLIPDFRGDREALKRVIDAKPDVINHNIEVVKELFPKMRPQGDYNRSLYVLRIIKEMNNRIITKSGFMVGLGETNEQILKTMQDLKENGVDILTIGQYLQPTKNHAEVRKYYTPEEFTEFRDIAMDMGFKHIESAPLVRSSYHAEQALNNVLGL